MISWSSCEAGGVGRLRTSERHALNAPCNVYGKGCALAASVPGACIYQRAAAAACDVFFLRQVFKEWCEFPKWIIHPLNVSASRRVNY